MFRRLAMILAVMLMSGAAMASSRIYGQGPTPEMACWKYEQNANRASYERAECYASCKVNKVQYEAERKLYTYVDSVPNHKGSCEKARYDRKRVSAEEFVRRYPEPGKSVPTSVAKPAPAT